MIEILLLVAAGYLIVKANQGTSTSTTTVTPQSNVALPLTQPKTNTYRPTAAPSFFSALASGPSTVPVSGFSVKNPTVTASAAAAIPQSSPSGGTSYSGGTTGGGGGGISCFSANTRVHARFRNVEGPTFFGLLPKLEPFEVKTLFGWRKARLIEHEKASRLMFNMGNDERVTHDHLFLIDGRGWIPASMVFTNQVPETLDIPVFNIHVETDYDWEQNFILENGKVAHNSKAITL